MLLIMWICKRLINLLQILCMGRRAIYCDFFQDAKGFSMLLLHSLGHGDSGRWLTVTGLSLFFFYIHIQSIQSNRISLQYYFLYVMYMYIIKVIQQMPLNPYFLGVRLQLKQMYSRTYTENWSVRPVWSNLYMYVALNFRQTTVTSAQNCKGSWNTEISNEFR